MDSIVAILVSRTSIFDVGTVEIDDLVKKQFNILVEVYDTIYI